VEVSAYLSKAAPETPSCAFSPSRCQAAEDCATLRECAVAAVADGNAIVEQVARVHSQPVVAEIMVDAGIDRCDGAQRY
jgi:hypothetical protein